MPDKTHYETLGVPEGATLEDIKKQYRSLARKYHPDVNPGNDAATRLFTTVTEAYRTLSDPEARRVYDAELSLRAREAKTAAERAARPTARPAPAARPGGAYPSLQEAEKLVNRARAAFVKGQMAEARGLAEEALRFHRSSAGAHEVLGDVYKYQGRADDAIKHYTYCLQFDPHNAAVRQRMERLIRETATPQPSAYVRPTPRAAPSVLETPEKRSLALALFALLGYGSVVVLFLYAAFFLDKRDPPPGVLSLPMVRNWTGALLGCLAGGGALLGATMSATGAVRRIEDDFLLGGFGAGRPRTVPLGVMILLLGALNFYIAALVHLAVSVIQETMHPSLVKLYGAVLALTLAIALPYTPGAVETLIWGGNIVFLGHFAGRLLGDFFRPD